MIAWFARNDVAANLLMATLLLLGIMSLQLRIPLEVFPTFGADTISVSVSLRGSTPEEAEQSVAIRIEEAVQDLEGIEKISSRSTEGNARVTIEVDTGYDPRELLNDVKTRVDAINTFPAEAEKPVISLAIRTREVIDVSVSGPFSEKEIRQQAERVRDDLLQIPGITQLSLDDVRDYEISIEVSQDRLRQYNLRLADVAAAIQSSSLDLSAGNVKTRGGEVLIRLKGQAYDRPQFESIVVATDRDGSIVRLGDIAIVRDAFTEDPMQTRFNGQPAAMIEVFRVGDQSAIDVADKVKAYIASQQDRLPVGMELSTWRDRSKIVKARLQTLTSSAIQGGILVLALLTLFLRPSVALWVFIGIPVSFTGAFLVMPMFDISLNLMSLFGFILVLGIVVDDAIVTGENVYRHLENAESGEHAAIVGTREVAAPVTFGVLTTVVAFLPMTMIDGPRSILFQQLAVVIIPILLFSLIESKFVLPAHLKHINISKARNANAFSRWQQSFAKGFERGILRYYQPLLKHALAHRYTTLAVFLGVFIVLMTLVTSGWTRFVFFPRIPSETISVTLTMPAGTPFEVTDRHIEHITQQAMKLQQRYRNDADGESVIMNVYSTTGSGGRGRKSSNYGRVRFEITPPELRDNPVSNRELVTEWRKLVGTIPGAEELAFRSEIMHGGNPVNIQLGGNHFTELRIVADKVKERLATHQGIYDIIDSMSTGKEELRLQLKPEAYALGISESDVVRQVREAFYGYEAQRIQRGREDVRVMVRFPREERQAIANLQDFRITTADGRSVPVAQVVELVPGKSPTAIYRNDLKRTLSVEAEIDKGSVNMALVNDDMRGFLDELLIQYPGVSYSLEGEAKEQADSFRSLAYGLIFVLFAIYTLLAIPFKSYAQPLLVMSVIPFGTIGAFIGHWIMGIPMTLFSILGMLALIGVLVNDSLVLVDFINQQRRQHGVPVLDAVLKAGAARFRPVMLTSLTTFFGLVPLLFEQSTQAQFLIPMAVSLAFGIIFATFITLLLVPVNYLTAYELREWFRGRKLEFHTEEA
ncbi:efflux RND transporter permease subunit [Pseudomaricurvus alkylphenolicus]|uniref:efflux RND transporter permease subunit n=1 Tax=Pseudomaricurvus alkylphenolicus TaxID=1306991 RepID=UPI001424460A|nr:efflux RND transporter permease subunit [Pseudomaricurvus alkylphenolicus]NIB39703.1 efflux RND transporter permease subunit [Pseudomaricurvus alkylphenolicus]